MDAALAAGRRPPAAGTDDLAVLAYLSRDPAHPAQARPAAARHALAPVPFFYALAAVLLLGVVVPSARLALAYMARGRRTGIPPPTTGAPREAGLT